MREDEEGEGGKLGEKTEKKELCPRLRCRCRLNQMSLNKASSLVEAAQKLT